MAASSSAQAAAQSAYSSSLWEWFSPLRTPRKEPSSPHASAQGAEGLPSSSSDTAVLGNSWSMSLAEHEPRLLDARGSAIQSQTLSPFALRQLAVALPSRFAYHDWGLLYSSTHLPPVCWRARAA